MEINTNTLYMYLVTDRYCTLEEPLDGKQYHNYGGSSCVMVLRLHPVKKGCSDSKVPILFAVVLLCHSYIFFMIL